MMIPKNKYHVFPALTGIRFVAVTMVFIHHCAEGIAKGFLYHVSQQLYLGVELFFVLSGFLICYKYYEPATLNRPFLVGFFVKRFARVYPLYFLLTTFTFLQMYWVGEREHWWGLYFLNITFLKGFSSHFMFTGIYPAWSLTVEETFYLLAHLIFLIHKKGKLLFGQVLIFYAIGGLLLLFFSHFPFHGFFKNFQFMAMATFWGRCFEFFVGIWLALYIKKNGLAIKLHGFKKYTYIGLTGSFVVILLQAYFLSAPSTNSGAYLMKLIMSNVVFPVFVTGLLYGLIVERSVVQMFFSSRMLTLLGKSSYAFFLVHTSMLAWWIYHYVTPGNYWGMYIGAYVISIILYFTVEQPLRTLINKANDRSREQKQPRRDGKEETVMPVVAGKNNGSPGSQDM